MKKWQLSRLLSSISLKLKSSFSVRSSTSSRRLRSRRNSPSLELLQPRVLLSATSGNAGGGDIVIPPHYDYPVGVDQKAVDHAINSSVGQPVGALSVPHYSSLPGANLTIFLDFDGHITTNTAWNDNFGNPEIISPAYSLDGDYSTFSIGELADIYNIWQRVSEDFYPFNVNVTTVDPGVEALIKTNANDTQYGIRVVMTDDTEGSGAGGIAYINSFSWASDTPAWSYNKGGAVAADTVSHEVGHTLGLAHDGRFTDEEGNSVEYYGGHGSGETSWAPIMGAFFADGNYDNNLTQWDNGYYSWHTNTGSSANYGAGAGDLEIMTRAIHGVTYRTDDYGNSFATATQIVGTVNGLIERNTDVDYFRFNHTGGNLELNAFPFTPGPNLDIQLRLFDATGTLVATINPPNLITATYSEELAAGTYYIEIDGVGTGDPTDVDNPLGYNDYGSIGRYTLTALSTLYIDFYDKYEIPPVNVDLNEGATGVVKILDGEDDAAYLIDLAGRSFQYADEVFTGVYVSTNGTLSFGNAYTGYSNSDLSSFSDAVSIIAPYWDDFLTNVDANDSVLYSFRDVIGDSTPDLVIEWNVYQLNSPTSLGTFQAILELNTDGEAGDIVFNYVNTIFGGDNYDDGASASVGLFKNGLAYQQHSYNTLGAVVSGSALLYTMRGEADLDDEIDEATIIVTNGTKTYAGNIDSTVDVDLYQFNAYAGQTLRFNLALTNGSTLDSLLRVFDAGGSQLAFYDDLESGATGTYTFATDGVYYVGVSAYPNSTYSINTGLNDTAGMSRGQYSLGLSLIDTNDQISEATAVGSGKTDSLDFSGDVDMYSYVAQAGYSVTFTVKASNSAWSPIVRLFSASGSQLSIDTDGADGTVSITYAFVTSGTYYIGVSGAANSAYSAVTGNNDAENTAVGPYSIQVSLGNVAPTQLALSNLAVDENKAIGTVVGSFTTTDPNTGNTFTYTLVSGTGSTDNAQFTIVGSQLRTAAIFDYETKASYSIRVRTTDQGGLYFERTLTITVKNVDEPTEASVSIGNFGAGVAGPDTMAGEGYMMYSVQNVRDRFGTNKVAAGNANNFVAVQFFGSTWRYANNDTWVVFTPKSTDVLVAAINFNTDVVTLLKGSFGLVNGISRGYLAGDLSITANLWGGVANPGEFGLSGTFLTFAPSTAMGATRSGIAGPDGLDGTGYLMFSAENITTRFGSTKVTKGNADNFVAVQYAGGVWRYANNDVWVVFTPRTTDVLVAAVDFNQDLVTLLKGNFGSVNGISQGYIDSNIVVTTNLWGGNFNAGEFGLSGTYITFVPPTPIKGLGAGVAAPDNAVGQGYMMYSVENVRTRFGSNNIAAGNADHFLAVQYLNGLWYYAKNDTWIAFTPKSNDHLVAGLNFTLDTVTLYKGNFGVVNGINRGYFDGDLNILPNVWGGVANAGEFGLSGTFLTFMPTLS